MFTALEFSDNTSFLNVFKKLDEVEKWLYLEKTQSLVK